ncbi:MAG: hypothetical protein WCV62_02370 [Candidatus Peribacteraceae bacterium]|jgi:hypothetical protein
MASAPFRAIIGRFSYAVSQRVIDQVLRAQPFEFGAFIAPEGAPPYFPPLPEGHQEWFLSGEIRGCHYRGVDWDALQPLDEALVERMRECECIFMDMVMRLEWKRSIPYVTRKRWYLRHLRFWNDYLSRRRINLYLAAWMPHEIPDIIIYYLCKDRGISVLYLDAGPVRDTSFAESDWQRSAVQLEERYGQLSQEYGRVTDPEAIPLGDRFARRYRALTTPGGETPPIEAVWRSTYWQAVREMLLRRPVQALRHLARFATPAGIGSLLHMRERRKVIHDRNAFYNAHAIEPDFSRPYVYLTLHFQPEASTVPMAGAYVDQALIAQLLNAHLPDDVLIYVKEHPRESGWLARDVDSYRDFLELKKVRFIARHTDTFALREHCSAVATATGTVGFEAIFRGKPVLLFGHRFFQYAPGVFPIHTSEDCAKAIDAVFRDGAAPTLIQARLFLKAMEETSIHGVINLWHHMVTEIPDDEHVRACTEGIIHQLEGLKRQEDEPRAA